MKNWVRKRIAEISTVFEDGDWIESKDQSTDGIRLIQTGNVGNGIFKDRGEKARYISEATFKRLRCTEIFEGDCLVSRLPDPVGRACILPDTGEKMITAVDCTIIRFDNKQIVPNWFLYYSISNEYQNEIQKQVIGATRQRISRKNLGLVSVPVAPLSEQQRIVSILDKAFAAIDKAKANAEQNLKNAKELFESYLQEIMSESGYAGLKDKQDSGTKKILKSSNQTNPDSDKWEVKKLGEVAEIIGGGTPAKNNQKFYEGNIYWATVRDMKSEIITDTEFKINEDAVKKSSTNIIPKNNVIIATRVGLGKICKIQNDTAINQDLRGIIPKKKNQLEVDYLFYWFKSIASQIIAEGKGATVQGVTLPFIKGLPITLPPLKEQQTIVRQLDALRAETQKLEAVYQQKIANLEELKKSILQKAFAGELRGGEPAEPKTEKSRRDARIIENKINQTQPNPEGVI